MSTINPEIPSEKATAASASDAPAPQPSVATGGKVSDGSKWSRALYRKWRALSQKWRATISLSSLTALVVLYTQVVVPRQPSQTSFKVTSADAKFLRLKVWNSGHKPSRLISYRLTFPGRLMIENARLDQTDGDSVIEPGSSNVILTVKELLPSCKPGRKNRFTKEDIESLLNRRDQTLLVKVEVEVQESGHLLELTAHPFNVQLQDEPPADLVKNFILGRIPDVDEAIACHG